MDGVDLAPNAVRPGRFYRVFFDAATDTWRS
jgi:hypothetical protein